MDPNTNNQPSIIWDAVIVGSGPAGAAAAITLSRQGRRVLLVEKQASVDFKLGESLPPPSIGLIEQLLGPIESLEMYSHEMQKTSGNVSYWDSDTAQTSDFFFTPAGFGLCVDRTAFDQSLRDQAIAEGVILYDKTRFIACAQTSLPGSASKANVWQIELADSAGRRTVCASYLIDASGRHSVVSKSLDVASTDHDQLFAFARCYRTESDQDIDRYTRLEASPHGWWYSNQLPNADQKKNERLLVFHTDKASPQARRAATDEGFKELLNDCPNLSRLVERCGYKPVGKIRGAAANSKRLEHFCGDQWLAVGDAAQAYDPLSSQGIMKALSTGINAGQMIDYALKTQSSGHNIEHASQYIERYARDQQQRWVNYLEQLQFYYRSQPRWPDQPFWSARRQVSAATSSPFNLLREAS